MKAVVITAPGRAGIEQLPDPAPDSTQLLIRVDACGICGTDVHILDGDFTPTRYPIVPGHEFCGEVVAAGSDAQKHRVGDFVAVDPSLFCGHCRYCRTGHFNLCEFWDGIGVGATDGACAEFVKVPAANAFPLPPGLPRHFGTLIEPLACVVHGFDRIAARLGSSYLIYGAGTMGLMLGQVARHAGASRVDMVDVNAARFEVARRLCADDVATSADALSRGAGWDVVIDATGAVPAIEDGLRRVNRGGTFLVFGVASAAATAPFSPFRAYNDELTLLGSMAILHSFERALSLIDRGVIDCAALLTSRLPLESWGEALESFRGGAGLKTQVTPMLKPAVVAPNQRSSASRTEE
jgi:2-desacetyl-2-hydroxyethyl bacteriochlorophyllide A dehydrogenase